VACRILSFEWKTIKGGIDSDRKSAFSVHQDLQPLKIDIIFSDAKISVAFATILANIPNWDQ
jgi:RNA 3'-terminal phosphate cyclase